MPKFSPTSWHAKLHKFFHANDEGYYIQPTNLCPYFWSLVVGTLFFPFIFLIYLPGYFWLRYNSDDYYGKPGFYTIDGMFITVVTYLTLSFLFVLSGVVWATGKFYHISIIFWIVVGLICLTILINYIVSKYKKTNKKDSILTSYIEAKLEGICPKIDWEE